MIRADDIFFDTDVSKLAEIEAIVGETIYAVTMYGNLEGGETPFNQNGDLTRFLKGKTIALHHYKHVPISDGNVKDTVWEIMQAKDLIERLLETDITYFVPPCHILDDEVLYWVKYLGMEVLTGDNAEDLDLLVNENRNPRKDTEVLWYHWWDTDIEKLRQWKGQHGRG
jgi:peptidoglycan/xylan/chitin deacetylase (PgdA/CDA1 family)